MSVATPVLPHASFHPDADPAARERLLAVYASERRDMARRSLSIVGAMDGAAVSRAIANALQDRPDVTDELVFEDPAFVTWGNFLQRAVARRSEEETRLHGQNFAELFERVAARLAGEGPCYVPDTRIALQQSDLDPYVMAVTPPSYDFKELVRTGMNGHGHPLELQRDLVGIAVGRIRSAWPELFTDICATTKIIGYLPDATFRSCSAARYAGVMYLGNLDASVLDIEESIVHEAGHQVLYRVGFLEDLVAEGTPMEEDYTLPWSGTKRDLFGFLHAYYIYALLAKYFWRRARAISDQRDECIRRSALIMIGSTIATDMLLPDPNLTAYGRGLVRSLATELAGLRTELDAAHESLVAARD